MTPARPGMPVGSVDHSVVEPVKAMLPELEERGGESKAAPVRRSGDVAAFELALDLVDPALEGRTAINRRALGAGVGAKLVATGRAAK